MNPSFVNEKRIDALLRKEMNEHQSIISSHHKEMQELRDALKHSQDRFESLYEHCDMQIKDMAIFYNQQMLTTKERMIANEAIIADQKKTIESLHQQLMICQEAYASKIDMAIVKKELAIHINENTTKHLKTFQDFQRETKMLFLSLECDFLKFKSDFEKKIGDLIDKIEKRFSQLIIDKDSILKEIREWEKTIFIIEKKIENIYTLIDRLTKRGEVCHKQE